MGITGKSERLSATGPDCGEHYGWGVDSAASSPTAAQSRVIVGALEVFARNGVGGTSLQMIADEIGVTKAALFYQYRSKQEIVLAAAESELARLDDVISAAETSASADEAREVMIAGMVELAVERGRRMGTILSDPVIVGYFADHGGFRATMQRLRHVLIPDDHRPESAVRLAMVIAAVSGAVLHPFAAGLDDDTLRRELRRLTHAVLDAPD
jgi:AcrR family transcriptional regulator